MPTVLTVDMGGGEELVRQTLAGLPGDHQLETTDLDDRYRVATNNAGFLRFALENQGYGTVVSQEDF